MFQTSNIKGVYYTLIEAIEYGMKNAKSGQHIFGSSILRSPSLYYTISQFSKRLMISNGNNPLASDLPLTHKDLSPMVQR